MTDITKAMHDPTSVYNEPNDVVNDTTISTEDKVKILRQWEYDARELQVAEEEAMPTRGKGSMLNRVKNALHQLGACHDVERQPPTKHGGE